MNEDIKGPLLGAAKWAKFLSILGFIGIGLSFFALFSFLILGTLMKDFFFRSTIMIVAFISYSGIILLYFFPFYYLYRFAKNTQQAIDSDDPIQFTDSFRYLHSFFKYIGILIIVVISLYALLTIISFSLIGYTYRMDI